MHISVIMLAYNAEKTVEESIKSVLAQTYTDYEFIIINDASTDNTENIIKHYSKIDSRIHYYKNDKNSGVAYSRDLGIKLSCGEYVAFIDSDDLWDSDKLSEQANFIQRNPETDFVFTGSGFIGGDGIVKKYTMNVPKEITYRELLKQNVISCSSVFIRRTVLDGVFVPDDSMHEDFAAWLRILKKGVSAYGIDKPLLFYRLSAGSRSYNKFNAARMTWRVYRYIGLDIFSSAYNMCFYVFRSLKKYFKIYKK